MKAKFFLSCMALAILFSACNTTNRTPKQKIEQQIDSFLKDKKATVGVAVLANDEIVAVYNNQIHCYLDGFLRDSPARPPMFCHLQCRQRLKKNLSGMTLPSLW